MSTPDNSKTNWGIGVAAGAAIAASACCTIPLLLVAIGLGGAWIGTLTVVEPFRPFFITLAFGALLYAGFREWRISHGPDCGCPLSLSDKLRRALLAVGFVAVVGLVATPWLIRDASSGGLAGVEASGGAVGDPVALAEVVLEVEGMTCASCNITVQKALTNLRGVSEATVTFEPPQAVVRFDPSEVTPDDLMRATTNVGYPSKLKSSS